MLSFGKLVQNEWLKLSKKKSFYISYAVILIGIACFTYLVKEMSGGDVPAILDFASTIMTRGGMGQIITIIAIIFTAGIVAKEHQQGTVKFLMIRAHSRSKILASKYAVALLYIISLFVFTAVIALASGSIAFGFGAGESTWGDVAQAALYQMIYTAIYVTLTFMFGVITKSSGATIGIGMAAVLMEGLFSMLLARYEFAKYLLFLNTDLSVYNGLQPPMEGMTLVFSSIVVAVYVLLFLAASFVTFNKRDIA